MISDCRLSDSDLSLVIISNASGWDVEHNLRILIFIIFIEIADGRIQECGYYLLLSRFYRRKIEFMGRATVCVRFIDKCQVYIIILVPRLTKNLLKIYQYEDY